jgi:hypothetical protein
LRISPALMPPLSPATLISAAFDAAITLAISYAIFASLQPVAMLRFAFSPAPFFTLLRYCRRLTPFSIAMAIHALLPLPLRQLSYCHCFHFRLRRYFSFIASFHAAIAAIFQIIFAELSPLPFSAIIIIDILYDCNIDYCHFKARYGHCHAYAISLSTPLFSLADDIADIIFAMIFADYCRLHITPRH